MFSEAEGVVAGVGVDMWNLLENQEWTLAYAPAYVGPLSLREWPYQAQTCHSQAKKLALWLTGRNAIVHNHLCL
jgi:hypothetical protein